MSSPRMMTIFGRGGPFAAEGAAGRPNIATVPAMLSSASQRLTVPILLSPMSHSLREP
jgi:hypothetical protein